MSSSAGSIEVTISVPCSRIFWLMGCRPYQAQDSTPLHIMSSTLIVTSVCSGSYWAMLSWSSSSFGATMAKFLAGMPLRSGESPYRPNAIPILPSFRAASTIPRQMFFASVFWKIPR